MERYDLTKRETDIALCVCQGLTNEEIGQKLYISRFTVEAHLRNIFSKTGVKHRAGLADIIRPLPRASSNDGFLNQEGTKLRQGTSTKFTLAPEK